MLEGELVFTFTPAKQGRDTGRQRERGLTDRDRWGLLMWENVQFDEDQHRCLFCPVGHILSCELLRRDISRQIKALCRLRKFRLCVLVTQVQKTKIHPLTVCYIVQLDEIGSSLWISFHVMM